MAQPTVGLASGMFYPAHWQQEYFALPPTGPPSPPPLPSKEWRAVHVQLATKDEEKCGVCWENIPDHALAPVTGCSHALCGLCIRKLTRLVCPMCRAFITPMETPVRMRQTATSVAWSIVATLDGDDSGDFGLV